MDSASESSDVTDMERNRVKDPEPKVGQVKWGRKKDEYYGADTATERLKETDMDERWQELRDEEKIGMQMQQDLMKKARNEDFYDKEIMALIEKSKAHEEALKNQLEDEKKPSGMNWKQLYLRTMTLISSHWMKI